MKTVQLAMQLRVLALSLSIILSGLVVSATAGAATIHFSFTGNVLGSDATLSSPPSSPPFGNGQPMSGFFTVNGPLDISTDINPSNNIARYNNRITSLSVTIGTSTPYVATFGQPNDHIIIRNQPTFDSAELVVNKLISGTKVNGFKPTSFDINLVDGTHLAFDSQYPTTVPTLGSFLTTDQWRLVFVPGSQVVQGALTSISITAVPLPAAVILFGAGLIALVGLGAGSWRQRKNSIA